MNATSCSVALEGISTETSPAAWQARSAKRHLDPVFGDDRDARRPAARDRDQPARERVDPRRGLAPRHAAAASRRRDLEQDLRAVVLRAAAEQRRHRELRRIDQAEDPLRPRIDLARGGDAPENRRAAESVEEIPAGRSRAARRRFGGKPGQLVELELFEAIESIGSRVRHPLDYLRLRWAPRTA